MPAAKSSNSMVALDNNGNNDNDNDNDDTYLVFDGAGIRKSGYRGGTGLVGSEETWMVLQVVNAEYADWKQLNLPEVPP
jgi:hypothetical protein